MRYHVAGQSHRGAVRESNQDVVDWRINDAGDQALLVVADGMGGHQGGEVASRLAVDAISNPLSLKSPMPRAAPRMRISGENWIGHSGWPMSA